MKKFLTIMLVLVVSISAVAGITHFVKTDKKEDDENLVVKASYEQLITDLEKDIASSMQNVAELQAEIELNGLTISNLTTSVVTYKNQVASLESSVEKYEEDIIVKTSELEAKSGEIATLSAELESSTQENAELAAQIEILNTEKSAIETELAELTNEKETLETLIEEKNAEIAELHTQILSYQSEVSNLNLQIEELNEIIFDLNTKIDVFEEQLKGFEKDSNKIYVDDIIGYTPGSNVSFSFKPINNDICFFVKSGFYGVWIMNLKDFSIEQVYDSSYMYTSHYFLNDGNVMIYSSGVDYSFLYFDIEKKTIEKIEYSEDFGTFYSGSKAYGDHYLLMPMSSGKYYLFNSVNRSFEETGLEYYSYVRNFDLSNNIILSVHDKDTYNSLYTTDYYALNLETLELKKAYHGYFYIYAMLEYRENKYICVSNTSGYDPCTLEYDFDSNTFSFVNVVAILDTTVVFNKIEENEEKTGAYLSNSDGSSPVYFFDYATETLTEVTA